MTKTQSSISDNLQHDPIHVKNIYLLCLLRLNSNLISGDFISNSEIFLKLEFNVTQVLTVMHKLD